MGLCQELVNTAGEELSSRTEMVGPSVLSQMWQQIFGCCWYSLPQGGETAQIHPSPLGKAVRNSEPPKSHANGRPTSTAQGFLPSRDWRMRTSRQFFSRQRRQGMLAAAVRRRNVSQYPSYDIASACSETS